MSGGGAPGGRERRVHTLVVGAGSGGLTVAVTLAGFGRRVALAERGPIGGDCTNVGCIPSKTLIHLARLAARGEIAPEAVLPEVRRRRDALRDEEEAWVAGLDHLTLLRGRAELTGPHTARVEGGGGLATVRARHIVLATGSRPRTVEVPGLPDARRLTNDTVWDLDAPPAHLAILGAGTIGCELAFAFRRLGSRVSVVDVAECVLDGEEPEASALVERRLRAAGVEVALGARADGWDEAAARLRLRREGGGERALERVDRVLMALGRLPNLDLGLDAAGVETSERGVPTDGACRSNVRSVYAVGDVNERSAYTHTANDQGRRVARALALPWLPSGREPVWPVAAFTEPEVARVGPPRAALEERWHPALIRTVRVDLADTDRGYTMGLRDPDGGSGGGGFVLIHALRGSGRVLSATVAAPSAGEMIAPLVLAVNRPLSLYRLSALVLPYPVLSEAIKKAADRFTIETLSSLPREAAAWLRYRVARPPAPGGGDA